MQATRVQPYTVMVLTAVLALTPLWIPLTVVGVVMLVGACYPALNLFDLWVSLVTRRRQRTLLYPKRFATGLIGSMLIIAGLCGIAGWTPAAYIVSALAFIANTLQGVFLYCIGCTMFNAIILPVMQRRQQA